MRTIRHKGRGRYEVLGDDGSVVAGPMDKAEAVAMLGAVDKPRTEINAARQRRENDLAYQRRLAEDLAKPMREELAELKAVLAKRRDEDEVGILLRAFEPMLKAGKQAVRRERRRMIILPPAKAA